MSISRGRAIPTIIAAACVAEAVRRGEVQTCSGRSQDMRRDIEKKLCQVYGIADPSRQASHPPVNFDIYRDHAGQARVTVEIEGSWLFDHVIGESDARQFEQRYRDASRGISPEIMGVGCSPMVAA